MPSLKTRKPQHIAGDAPLQVKRRNRLANLLTEAAEIEHDVMVQYLFAAFSLKKAVSEGGVNYAQLEWMRGWATTMLLVARQEMEHLGLVTNLLTAIGEAPNFRRPNFPIPARTYPMNLPSSLDAFSPDVVLRFVCYEMPRSVNPKNRRYLEQYLPNFAPSQYDGIARTYLEIRELFNSIEAGDLFIGPPSAQFLSGGNSVVARGRIYPQKTTGKPPPIYDTDLRPVTDLKSANAVIEQIIDEGEGANDDDPNSHFARFLDMHRQLMAETAKDPNFKPARAVLSNPRLASGDEGAAAVTGIHYVTNPDTAQVMELFDMAYSTMVLMLMRYFAHTDESDADLIGLQDTAFFPMMTVGIRPLGEILTQLPAQEPDAEWRAGPSFVLPLRLQLLPHRRSAWRVILGELQMLTAKAEEAQKNQNFSPAVRERLALLYENFARMTMNFQDAMHARKMQ